MRRRTSILLACFTGATILCQSKRRRFVQLHPLLTVWLPVVPQWNGTNSKYLFVKIVKAHLCSLYKWNFKLALCETNHIYHCQYLSQRKVKKELRQNMCSRNCSPHRSSSWSSYLIQKLMSLDTMFLLSCNIISGYWGYFFFKAANRFMLLAP